MNGVGDTEKSDVSEDEAVEEKFNTSGGAATPKTLAGRGSGTSRDAYAKNNFFKYTFFLYSVYDTPGVM